jgi:hypothetical protein
MASRDAFRRLINSKRTPFTDEIFAILTVSRLLVTDESSSPH